MSQRRRQRWDPYTKDPKDLLEMLGRLLVGTSFREPVSGGGSNDCGPKCVCAICVAGALGYIKNPLKAELAIAVATRVSQKHIAVVSGKAYRRCAYAIRYMPAPRALKLHKAADRWRLRMLVYDVITELVWPEHQRPLGELAKDTKMRKANYARAHRVVKAELQQVLNEARSDFRTRLFAEDTKE